jgi:hypothetical protein
MAKVTIKLPKSILDFPPSEREQVLAVLREQMQLPKVQVFPRSATDEHNMWARNVDTLLADAEDEFYNGLVFPWAHNIGELISSLGLSLDDVNMKKSLSDEFRSFEDVLIKSKDSGRSKMSDYIKGVSQKRREQFLKWAEDGKALTTQQLQKIDGLLKNKMPNFRQHAEAYAVRAGFIGKIRNQAEREHFEVVGALVDRYPGTLRASRIEGVALTARQAEAESKLTGKPVKVLPLTPLEQQAVEHGIMHAGDKITEISEKQRAQVRQLVIRAKRERWTSQQLAQKLFDAFGDHNRDWRRVAITELSFVANDAYLSELEEGERVIGMGSTDACIQCRRLVIDKEFIYTKNPHYQDMKYVWAGKTNYGRPQKEWVPAIPVHPLCRCRWHRLSRFYKMEDGKAKLKSTAELINEERAKRGMEPDPNIGELDLQALSEQMLRKLNGGE